MIPSEVVIGGDMIYIYIFIYIYVIYTCIGLQPVQSEGCVVPEKRKEGRKVKEGRKEG
jgi:hypothetical protein